MIPSMAIRGSSSAAALAKSVPLLMSPKMVNHSLTSSKTVLLDCSWQMPGTDPPTAKELFQSGPRLPKAQFWDVDKIATTGDNVRNLPHMMPNEAKFSRFAGSMGIDRQSHVVLYDHLGLFSSPRVAFTFLAMGHPRVSILNGGLPAWVQAGFEVEEGEPLAKPEKVEYQGARLQDGSIRQYEEMLLNLAMGERGQTVLDARSKGRYDGTAPEPRPGLSSGHIPGSLSMPFSNLVHTHDSPLPSPFPKTYTTLKFQTELYRAFSSLPTNTFNESISGYTEEGVSKGILDFDKIRQASSNGEQSVVMTCGSGMTAAVLWLGLKVLGVESSIYDESWMGWAGRELEAREKSEEHRTPIEKTTFHQEGEEESKEGEEEESRGQVAS